MFAESKEEKAKKAEVNGLESNQHIEAILIFLEKYIPTFTNEIDLLENENENSMNSQLSSHLNDCRIIYNNIFPYSFSPEVPNSKEDIQATFKSSITNRHETLFVIECKRLPAPPPPQEREKEYLVGKGGGIHRFKNLRHGKNFSIAAMIGYIEKENFSYWFTLVNSWIEELSKQEKTIWSHKEKLQKKFEREEFAKYISNHSRTNHTFIKLVHFWILK